jgi:hypothetical protein
VGIGGWSLNPTIGLSPSQVRPSSAKRLTMRSLNSYSVTREPSRSAFAIASNVSSRWRKPRSPAHVWLRSPSSPKVASNCWTRSALVAIFGPNDRISSTVPASTKPMYGMLFVGRVLHRDRLRARDHALELLMKLRPSEVCSCRPGRASSIRGSTRCASFTGSPVAGR